MDFRKEQRLDNAFQSVSTAPPSDRTGQIAPPGDRNTAPGSEVEPISHMQSQYPTPPASSSSGSTYSEAQNSHPLSLSYDVFSVNPTDYNHWPGQNLEKFAKKGSDLADICEVDVRERTKELPTSELSLVGSLPILPRLSPDGRVARRSVYVDHMEAEMDNPQRATFEGQLKTLSRILIPKDVKTCPRIERMSSSAGISASPLQPQIMRSCAGESGHETVVKLLVDRDDVVADFPNRYGQDLASEASQTSLALLPSACFTSSAPSLEDEFSEESIAQSEDSDDTAPPSPEDDAKIALVFAKHQLIVSLMQDVYTMFDSQWNVRTRGNTTCQSDYANTQSQQSETANQSSTKKGKRRTQDRDSSPPDDKGAKRKKENPKGSSPSGKDRNILFACPFHKNDPLKYRASHQSGIDFRSCAGPGFQTISRLK